LYYLLNSSISTPALDTSDTGTFEYVYRNGSGGWTRVASQTQINITQYDDGTGTLATLGNNRYGIHYVYAVLNNPSHYKVVYGTEEHHSLSEAQSADMPALLPSDLDALSTAEFLGKIIIKKSVVAFEDIQSPYTHALQSAVATTHNNLAGLQGGEVDDYYHLTNEQVESLDGIGKVLYAFEDTTERDAFFTANPALLVTDVLIVIKDTTPPPTPGTRAYNFSKPYNSQYLITAL